MNKTMLIGRLTQNPEVTKTTNAKTYVRTTLAVNRRFKNEDGGRDADFIGIILWGRRQKRWLLTLKKGLSFQLKGRFVHIATWTSKIKNVI